jgi:hypothetical protein
MLFRCVNNINNPSFCAIGMKTLDFSDLHYWVITSDWIGVFTDFGRPLRYPILRINVRNWYRLMGSKNPLLMSFSSVSFPCSFRVRRRSGRWVCAIHCTYFGFQHINRMVFSPEITNTLTLRNDLIHIYFPTFFFFFIQSNLRWLYYNPITLHNGQCTWFTW